MICLPTWWGRITPIVLALAGLLVTHATRSPAAVADEPRAESPQDKQKVKDLRGALDLVTEGERVPKGLKLEAIKLIRTPGGAQYTLTFREGKRSHVVQVRDNGDFKIKTQPAQEGKAGYWESAPDPVEVVAATAERIEKATSEMKRAGVKPGDILMAEYRAGFQQFDDYRGRWTVSIGLKGEDPKSEVKAKVVTFEDDRLTKTADGKLILFNLPF